MVRRARYLPSPMDAVSRSWVDGLRTLGRQHDLTVARLRALLLRAACREVWRRRATLHVAGAELDDLAHQAADDAVVAILAKLDGFRGDSRFTTWAYKFVMLEVSTKIGRHFARASPARIDEVDWEQIPDRLTDLPEQRVERRELLATLRRAVDEELSERQRRVFVAVALNEVPMDALAHELGSNRNAIYKTLFDARLKLKASLAAAGHALEGSRS
jgi:RNA polymerase sigma-70 factor, ECF subfamily